MKKVNLIVIAFLLFAGNAQARDYWDARREIQAQYHQNGGNYYYNNGYYYNNDLSHDEKLILGAALIYAIAKNNQSNDPATRERKAFEQGIKAREREIQAERERRAYECGYYGKCGDHK